MADRPGKPLQERTYDTSLKCLTSRGRSEIAFPPNLRHLEKPTVYEGHQIRPPERIEASRDVRASDAVLGATFDLSGDPVSVDFVSLADQPSLLYTRDQPPTKFDDGAPVDRHRNDSSPHLDGQQGNPTCYATSTTALENQHVYNRPENYRHPKMASYEMRFQTYQDWPHRQPRVVDLVNANMFYEGKFLVLP